MGRKTAGYFFLGTFVPAVLAAPFVDAKQIKAVNDAGKLMVQILSLTSATSTGPAYEVIDTMGGNRLDATPWVLMEKATWPFVNQG